MKFIISNYGTVGLDVSADDVVPKQGYMAREIIEYIAATYQFAVRPGLPAGFPATAFQHFSFQSGIMTSGNDKWPILHLALIPNGDITTAATTEIADTIMTDLTVRLDSTFGFRFAASKQRRIYQSNIVVQFDRGIEEKIEAVGKIEAILNREINRPTAPFKIKRFAFGSGEVTLPTLATSIEAIEKSDFVIERRARDPYSENRYFSSAPVQTSDHIKILEMIEQSFSG